MSSACEHAAAESVGAASLYRIVNMDCPMEEALIRKKLANFPGVTGLEFNLIRRVLTVRHELPSAAPIEAALQSIGMTPEPLGLDTESNAAPAPKIPWPRMAVAGVFAAFSEAFELMNEWDVRPFGFETTEWPAMILAVAAISAGGLTTYKKGWIAVKTFNLNINALMSVAVTGALVIGQYPEAAMVMVLFNMAEAIEAMALNRARGAIKNLMGLTPEKAVVKLADGTWAAVDIRQVAVGSLVRVRPGERLALDGVVERGRSTVNQAPITGESMPVEKTVGDAVYAGAINESGSFEFRVTSTAGNSTLARIIHAVEGARGGRAPMQRFVDQFAKYYTPAVFLAAIVVAVIPPLFMGGSWSGWLYTALVMLVIGCPCALVISTPVTIVSGLAAAAKRGILIKGGLFLEQGRELKWLALDKTGTITHGKPRQTDFVSMGPLDHDRAVSLAASLAAHSDHPVSMAIAEHALEHGLARLEVSEFAAIPGRGISGIIGGRKWRLGNHRLAEELKQCSPELENIIFGLETRGKTVVALIGGQEVQALFAVADTIKETSLEAIRELKKMGIKTMMLTGDNEHTARVIAEQVGADGFKGNLLPEDKVAEVEKLESFPILL